MSRYLGPRIRILRRLGGPLPAFCSGKPTGKKGYNTPGQHGKPRISKFPNRRSNESPYSLRLKAKQTLRFNYHITERQLFNYVKKARKIKGPTGKNLLVLLEMRLDNIFYRMGLARTIIAARQCINHGHITVNNQKVTIPSYNCQILDTIRVRNKPTSRQLVRRALIPYVGSKPKKSSQFKFGFDKNKKIGYKNRKINPNKSGKPPYQASPTNQSPAKAGVNTPLGNKDSQSNNPKNLPSKNVKLYSTYRIPKYLNVCRKTLTGVVKRIVPRKQVRLKIEELLVVEYYSRG